MRCASEDIELTALMREYDILIEKVSIVKEKLLALGLDIVELRKLDE